MNTISFRVAATLILIALPASLCYGADIKKYNEPASSTVFSRSVEVSGQYKALNSNNQQKKLGVEIFYSNFTKEGRVLIRYITPQEGIGESKNK